MNKPIHPVMSLGGDNPAYDADVHGWALAQAEFLRAGQLDRIDWLNVVEEIEDVARSERRTAESALRIIMAHVLKWQIQPERRGRSWSLSIKDQRLVYRQSLRENPSLASRAEQMRDDAFGRARIEAAREMDMPLKSLPETPLAWTTILDEPFDWDI